MNKTITVLCVDDDREYADLTATFLEKQDSQLSVLTAMSAASGLELLADRAIDCVVSDYNMPGMNGIAFLEAVRTDQPDLPFILYTGRGSEEIASDAISAGVTDYMQKETHTDHYAVLAQRVRNLVSQYRAEKRATETQQRAQTILNASPDAILVGCEEKLLYSNPSALELFGADTEAQLGDESMVRLVHPSDREKVAETIGPVQTGERQITRTRYTVQTLDGESVPVEVTARSITWDDESAVVAILRDLSAQRTAEQGKARYKAAFEKAFDAMVIANDEGQYIDANESACDLFGLPQEELLGHSIRDFAPEEFDFEAAWQQFQETDRERGTFPLVRAVSGDRRTVEYAATPNIVPGEHLSVLRDITERKHNEEELKQQNKRLEEFASVISHDLRNPLTTARGYLELARTDADPDHFDVAAQSLDRMERIIEDVLWLAREGQTIGATEEVDIRTAIENAWKMVTSDKTDADLVFEGASFESITADSDRFSQLLENLLRNAIKHGGPDVVVKVTATEEGFAIEDDGPGIPEPIREQVFERGYSMTDDGTGFGLHIVKQIAEAHEWEVSITDSESGGARIDISGVPALQTQ